MTGRGHSGRGDPRSHSDFLMENRRGRGRQRNVPFPTKPLMQSTEPTDSDDFGIEEDEHYELQRMVEEDGAREEETSEQDKKAIQQRKMMMVAPMAQKRVRGRPRRQSTSSQAMTNDDLLEEEMMDQHGLIESGPLEAPGPSETTKPAVPLGRGSRVRQAPKRLNDFVSTETSRSSQKKEAQDESVTVATSAKETETEEDLIQDDLHAEQIEHEEEVIDEASPSERTEEIEELVDVEHMRDEEEELEEPEGPPPAPRHLMNKANGRGRPANPVPPHRRPIPKDLMPPGTLALKRASTLRDPNPVKRKDVRQHHTEEINEGPPPLRPPRAPATMKDETPPPALAISEVPMAVEQVEIKEDNAPEAVTEEVVISGDDGPPPMPAIIQQASVTGASSSAPTATDTPIKKKEREAGKDLPSEHFPKEKARHVSTRGLHPFIAEKSPMMGFEMRDQVMMEEMEEPSEEDAVSQQRVLTLQGGSFIDDRIGRGDMMEDEEMKLMKGMQAQQYIVEENGVMNVVYGIDPNAIIEGEGQVEIEENEGVVQEEEQYVIEEHQIEKEVVMGEEEDDDDDLPPQLVPEINAEEPVEERHEEDEKGMAVDDDAPFDFNMMHEGELISLQSPGGRNHEVRVARDEQGNTVFIDENNQLVQLITDTGAVVEPNNMIEQAEQGDENGIKAKQRQGNDDAAGSADRANVEFMNSCSFLDTNNICCGLCGEIVLYEKLVSEHLPNAHPEYLSAGVELEEVPYNSWLKTRLKQESKMMENGFRHYDEHDGAGFGGAVRLYSKGLRQLRKVSQIRVNVNEMTIQQLEMALKRKLIEKMGRKVPVSLVDRLHARCDICQAVVSLNKKFEVIHLVRHFNAWHPAEHRCSQEWKETAAAGTTNNSRRPLSLHDFAVVSTETDQNNLQCIWCGMMMDRAALGMHFSEVHAQSILVPNCSLCLQEMVMTARLMEKYGEDFGISLPDEFHLHSSKLSTKCSSEKAMDKAIDKYLKKASKLGAENDEEEVQDDQEAICTTNSQQSFGRRNRLKRKFVKPCFRQICPQNSAYFEAKSACQWKCRLCGNDVYGAVISAGAIKHYKEFHPAEIDSMQYELVKARLERIGDGSMEFVHPQLVECLICSLTYALHKPFNICRAIRHLRLKHPEVMPETAGKPISGAEIAETTNLDVKPVVKKPQIRFAEVITDPIELEKFRKENFDQQFDKVQVVYGIKKNNEPAFILLMENETMDHKTAMEMAEKMRAENDSAEVNRYDRMRGRSEEEEEEEEGERIERYEAVPEDPSSSQMYLEDKPTTVKDFLQQIISEDRDDEVGEIIEGHDGEFIQTYDANNPDHVLIEENDLLNDGGYEMIQEGEYQEIEEDNRTVRYLTEEEIREAQERGEILEFAEEDFVDAEYADGQDE